MTVTLKQTAELLLQADRILILSHAFPDGDTLGSAAALMRALRALGKQTAFHCEHAVPGKFQFLFEGLEDRMERDDFDPHYIVCVDVADQELLGKSGKAYEGKIDLCIDHHGSNKCFARCTYVDAGAAAAAQILYELFPLLGVEMDDRSAACIYTGITTDTGCFRYSNTTPATLRTAAALMERGVNCSAINSAMFETKSRSRFEIERMALESMEYACGGKVALMILTLDMIERSGADEEDLDGITAIPRTIEGVMVGITIRERQGQKYKVSMRTKDPAVRACDICAVFGGGGHPGAAGCTLEMPLEEAKKALLQAAGEYLERIS